MAVPADSSNPFAVGGNLRWRKRIDLAMRSSATFAAMLAVGVLVLVLAGVAVHGASAINGNFFTQAPPIAIGATGGGILPEIVGTLIIVLLGTAFALPIGVAIAIYQTEFAPPRIQYPIRLALDLLNGLPSIVVAVFVYGLLVLGHPQKAYTASIALAIIMLPLISRATQEVLRLVPQTQRDAAYALGMSKWRTTFGVVLPSCLSGILTGTVLAVARAAGETAPVLLLSSIYNPNAPVSWNPFTGPIPNIPMEIFNESQAATPADHTRAWGSALVLIAMILIISLLARYALARTRRKMYS
jgi:phosphate transport system permease protein